MKDDIINHIQEYRSKTGITQAELAQQVGVSRQSIISIERGRYIPSLSLALRIARYFQCSTDTLFQLEERRQNG